jgi:hypothetical protein
MSAPPPPRVIADDMYVAEIDQAEWLVIPPAQPPTFIEGLPPSSSPADIARLIDDDTGACAANLTFAWFAIGGGAAAKVLCFDSNATGPTNPMATRLLLKHAKMLTTGHMHVPCPTQIRGRAILAANVSA